MVNNLKDLAKKFFDETNVEFEDIFDKGSDKSSNEKYYRLMRYSESLTPVGAEFAYADGSTLDEVKEAFSPHSVTEISKEEYDKENSRAHRHGVWLATGHYPED